MTFFLPNLAGHGLYTSRALPCLLQTARSSQLTARATIRCASKTSNAALPLSAQVRPCRNSSSLAIHSVLSNSGSNRCSGFATASRRSILASPCSTSLFPRFFISARLIRAASTSAAHTPENLTHASAYESSQPHQALPHLPTLTHPIVTYYLLGIATLVFAIVVVGGLTRLTESGLSITEWNLVTGTLPPLSEDAWIEELRKYRLSPEGRL